MWYRVYEVEWLVVAVWYREKYLFLIRTELITKRKVQEWQSLVSATKGTGDHTSLSFVLLLSFLSLKEHLVC